MWKFKLKIAKYNLSGGWAVLRNLPKMHFLWARVKLGFNPDLEDCMAKLSQY